MRAEDPTDPTGGIGMDTPDGCTAIGGVLIVLALGISSLLVLILRSPWF